MTNAEGGARHAAVDIIRLTAGDLRPVREAEGGRAGEIDMVVIHCQDGALGLPAEMFSQASEHLDYKGDAVPWRVAGCTRPEYLRIIASRSQPGTPEVFDRREDYDAVQAIMRERGIEPPGQQGGGG